MGSWAAFLWVAVVVLVAAYAFYRRRQRRLAMERLAAGLGWRYFPGPDRGFDSKFSHGPFHEGHSRKARNVIRGILQTIHQLPTQVTLGDYQYTVGSGKNSHTYTFSFLLLELPLVMLPGLHLRREWLADKLAAAFGFDDIDFESDEFSRKFMVKSGNKRFAYDVIHPRMMEFLLATSAPRLELKDDVLLVWEGNSADWTPDGFRKQIAWVREFLELWPEHVVAQFLPPATGQRTA